MYLTLGFLLSVALIPKAESVCVPGTTRTLVSLKASPTLTERARFGATVAVSTNGLVVAATARKDALATRKSSVYVARKASAEAGEAWQAAALLEYTALASSALSPSVSYTYGACLALSADGTWLVVGHPSEHGDASSTAAAPNANAHYAGAVYVYKSDDGGGGTYTLFQYVKADVVQANAGFGIKCAMDDASTTLAVVDSGRRGVLVLRRVSTDDEFAADTFYADEQAAPHTGGPSSVAVSRNSLLMAVGSARYDTVYVYARDAADVSFDPVATLTPPDGSVRVHFGHAVAFDVTGSALVIGAPMESGNASSSMSQPNTEEPHAGAVYVAHEVDGTWTVDVKLKAANAVTMARFGYAVATSSERLWVGAPYEEGDASSRPAQFNANAVAAGVVYGFSDTTYAPVAYVKDAWAHAYAWAGMALAADVAGSVLVAGAPGENSQWPGLYGAQRYAVNDDELLADQSTGAALIYDWTCPYDASVVNPVVCTYTLDMATAEASGGWGHFIVDVYVGSDRVAQASLTEAQHPADSVVRTTGAGTVTFRVANGYVTQDRASLVLSEQRAGVLLTAPAGYFLGIAEGAVFFTHECI